ncbi:MAG: EAL domain-containing protein [Nevskia sp.]|nr:EAL domain-containing protein [Nevskia sp.]
MTPPRDALPELALPIPAAAEQPRPVARTLLARWLFNLSIRAKLAMMVLAFSVAILGLLAIMNFSLVLSTGVRGYIQSEGLWSGGQKDGVYWLVRYLRTHDEADYHRYEDAIRVPLGDRMARLELDKPQIDEDLVMRAFIAGGNAVEDFPSMLSVYRHFAHSRFFTPALATWAEGDKYVLRLVDLATVIHAAVTSGNITRERQDQLLAQLDAINGDLTRLEQGFTAVFGNGSRLAQQVLLSTILASALLLMCCGLLVSWWVSRGIQEAIQGLRAGAMRVSAGDLEHQIEVRTRDELGELADSFNEMVRCRRDAEEELRRANEFRERVMQNATNAIFVIDLQGRFTMVNRRTCEVTGYAEHEMIGSKFSMLLAPEYVGGISIMFREQVLRARSVHNQEADLVRRDGTRFTISFSSGPLFKDGEIFALVGTAEDVTERKRTEAYIRHTAQHDALTGLPNRALLLDRLEMAMRQTRRNGRQVAVLMIDLDHFKRVNDTLGHQFGDRLLLSLSEQLKTCVRDVDTVARLGGDEFVIVLVDVRSRDELIPVIAKITDAISTPVTIDGHELLVTPSIGGCLYPDDGTDTTTLLKHADVAMYQAKAAGRSNIQWFTEAMMQETADRLALGSALRRAIEHEELSVFFQPEICLRSGRIVGMEALARWHHPERGFIAPGRFIPVAEETGQILQLGEWMLRNACRECAEIQRRTGLPLRLAVNVSPRQFQQQDWLGVVEDTLATTGLAAEHLELEITEGMLMRNPEESAEVLRRLRTLGVTVVIDDFGTGYSSLSYLTRFPIDKIKIDHSFVRDLTTDTADAAVINAIIAMAHSLDIRVVAEGVEDEAQQAYLREHDCDEAQGFFYSAAIPADRFVALMS